MIKYDSTLTILLALAGCSKTDSNSSLVGTWQTGSFTQTNRGTLAFYENGTFNGTAPFEINGTWKLANPSTLLLNYTDNLGQTQQTENKIELSHDHFVLDESASGHTLEFHRQN